MIRECNFIKNIADTQSYDIGRPESFYPRIGAINGPNVIPWSVREKIGLLDDRLAPYGYDDPEYCLRAMKAGFINGLYPLKYKSDVDWGGTRRSKKFLREVRRIHCRNRVYVWEKHGDYIKWLLDTGRIYNELLPVTTLDGIPDCREIKIKGY